MNKQDYILLVERTRAGDQEAGNALVNALTVRLRLIVKHRVWWWSVQDQDDAVQSALEKFLGKLDHVRDNPCGFVVQMLHHVIGNELQWKQRRTDRIGIEQDGGPTSVESNPELVSDLHADRGIESEDELAIIIRAIDSLKPFCRLLFKGLVEGLTPGDIWEAVRIAEPQLSRSAFDKRTFDCRRQLRQQIQKLS